MREHISDHVFGSIARERPTSYGPPLVMEAIRANNPREVIRLLAEDGPGPYNIHELIKLANNWMPHGDLP